MSTDFSTPPADDVREALTSRLERSFGPFLAHWPHDPHRFFGGAADEVIAAFEVSPRGTVTDAEVEVAREQAKWMHLSIFGNDGPTDDKWDRILRAALEAARGAQQ